jgi:amino acid adenylation domain-containing protein
MTSDDSQRAELLEQAIRLKKAAARSRAPDITLRPEDQPARVSAMQRSIWLAHQMDRQSPAYNLTSAYRVRGELKVVDLQRALYEVVARHRLLRSTFQANRDEVHQIVHSTSPVEVEVREVGAGRSLATAVSEAQRPFDLETGPLLRLLLIEEPAEDERLLLLVLHHILADERSLASLWRELAEAYDGRPASATPRVQYDDYVHWMAQRDRSERVRQIEYWRRRLDPLPEDLQLPFERQQSDHDAPHGHLLGQTLRPAVQEAMRELASACGSSPFMVFAFAFRLLLSRYTDGRRVAFATPVSTRSHPDTLSMLGYFLNPVVVATAIDESRSVVEAVRAFSSQLKEALAHASLPFDVLSEELSPRRHRDRHPIFQAMFVYQEGSPPPEFGDALLEPVTLDLGASKFDLTLFATDNAGNLEIAVEYRRDRFDEGSMTRLLDHYGTLLQQLPSDPERTTAEVPMMSPAEQNRIRAHATGPDLEVPEATLLPLQILERARNSPQLPAVVCGGRSASYGDLANAARSIAARLAAVGVSPGDRVGLFIDRSWRMIAGILGIHRAGAAYVPLDPGYPQKVNHDLLDDAEVAAVVTRAALRGGLADGPWPVIDAEGRSDEGSDAGEEPALSPETTAYILYTSGSTGRPKGVVVTQGNLLLSTAARRQVYDSPPKVFLLVPSVAFDSSVAGIFWTLAETGTLVIPTHDEARDPRRMAALVAEHRVTSLLCVPSLYEQMLRTGSGELQGLETAIVAGEACPSRLVAEHFRVLPHVRLFNEYGPTEATVWATVHEITKQDAARPVAIGRPIPGVRFDVLDGLGRSVPEGVPGHAWIAGSTVAKGYWRRPELSAERFKSDPESGERRYRTGDRVAWTREGRLLFLGREDEQIKLRGYRIEPGEVEAALLGLPGVDRAAVVARRVGALAAPHPDSDDTQLVAFVVTSKPVVEWRQVLADRLPAHLVPSRLVELDDLPRLPNGKIDRQQLRDIELEIPTTVGDEDVIPNTREQTLIALWEGLLGRSGIGVNDNFFELGGHSLLVVEMTVAIEQDFGVSLAVADVFENPTVRELTTRIEQRRGRDTPAYDHLFPIQPVGREAPLIVAIPHFFTEMFANRFRGERPVYGLRGVGLRPEGNLGRWRTMSDLGAELVDEICRRFPEQTFIMAGYSFGASMAFEAVRLMEERNIPVRRLYLIAPMPLDLYRLGPVRLQIDGLQEPVDELSIGEALARYARANNPLTLRPYRRAWRWFAIEPWRRLLCGVGRIRRLFGQPLTTRLLYADVRVDRFRLHAAYRPRTIRTPTVIFNATEPETDAAATWRRCFEGPLTVHETPDPHLGESTVDDARVVILRHLTNLGDA